MPIPDEKARAWTRPEDYWPPRRPRRKDSGRPAVNQFASPRDGSDTFSQGRPLLGIVPYALLMMSLAVLAATIIVLAWPGRTLTRPAEPAPAVAVPGTAEKGWMDGR
jgi:hypothetical protein